MKKALVIDPFSGASGDMFLGALVDLGVSFDGLRDTLHSIPALAKVKIERESVTRGVFVATRIRVTCPHEHEHRSLSTIKSIIEAADLDERVKKGAIGTFTMLARAEAKVHGSDVEDVHFHEVGALDAIADIIGAHVAWSELGYPECLIRPIAVGSGEVSGAHGKMPVPAPATLELLGGFPARFTDRDEELVTPTGAALIASMGRPLPANTIVRPEKVGCGAGSREGGAMPNVLRAVLGTMEESRGHVCIITSTLDDMNPEVYGYLMEQAFANGALEIYFNSVMMKKNRPGIEVTLIAEEKDVYALADFLMANTTTIGVRIHREERVELPRRKDTVDTPFGRIDVKVATRPAGTELVSPEFESCRRAARENDANILDVYEAARRAWDEKQQT